MAHSVNPCRWMLAAAAVSTLLVLGPVAKATELADSEPGLPSLDELLASDAAVDYDQSKRCLSLHKFDEVRALDENHVLFEMKGDKYYLVQLERRCPGLMPQNAVGYEHRSSRLCATDRVRGIGVTGGFSPTCQLGRFQPISEEQLALLEEAIKHRARNPDQRGKPLKDPKPSRVPTVSGDSVRASKS